ncbi:26S proteasome non-ATPase regulatory subunit 4 [Trichonephila inaurata madagascariensis]|uniref:26S proteasome non-ATPase regulatory subunit 4 n=1 Tax=Trichonephila inaurata madagascariensis TaxID=2747483 RepID=A0A8X6WVU0_9ARAC|nr:26S proteasome non-ATPase regulatory subunit 4 [Trichonephila inaurata madagascariensis]
MVLESTIICVDNSDYMRNGDFLPSRLQAQQDAVSLICHSKIRSNPENNVGLLTLAKPEVLTTLTTDVGKLLSKLHQVQPKGYINLCTGIRVAHLALKHRQGKHHKMRIVIFVGSPVDDDDKEIVKLAKKFKKEKVCVDIVNFGEDATNTDKLTLFINTLNGKDGSGSHLVTVPPGPHLSDALVSSPVVQGEDGSGAVGIGGMGFEFGVDPNEDPELALALRVSMEEQRQRQEEEARRTVSATSNEPAGQPAADGSNEEAMLEQAVAMSLATESNTDTPSPAVPDFSAMTEEEQIAYAMQMSLQQTQEGSDDEAGVPMETDDKDQTKEEEEDLREVMDDPEFLQSVLRNLPGVDPQSEVVRNAVSASKDKKSSPKKEDKSKK